MADQAFDFKHGDNEHNLLRKILGRLKELVLGGSGGTVTLDVSDVEVGAVEIKDAATDTRAVVRGSDPVGADNGVVVRNIPSGTQSVSGSVGVNNFPAVQPVNDNGGSLTVDGSIAAIQSGTWTVQPGDTQNSVPWLVANDWRRNSVPKRYAMSSVLIGAVAAGTNVYGLRKLNANSDVYILKIRFLVFHIAAGVSVVLGWHRAANVAGGSIAVNIPKLDTSAPAPNLEVRIGAVTGTEDSQFLMIHPSHTTAAPAANVGSPWIDTWNAHDRAGAIRLTGDEGLVLEQITAGDADNRYVIHVEWEEA